MPTRRCKSSRHIRPGPQTLFSCLLPGLLLQPAPFPGLTVDMKRHSATMGTGRQPASDHFTWEQAQKRETPDCGATNYWRRRHRCDITR